MNRTRYPVAIVGAGPVGLTTANLLGRYGVRCVLIERDATTRTHPRAQSIDDESMRTLQSFDCASRFESLTIPAAGSYYSDGDGKVFGRVGPGPKDFGFMKRQFMLQQQLDELLLSNLRNYSSVEARLNTTVIAVESSSTGATLVLQSGDPIECRYLLAADGGQSLIRKTLGIRMQGWTYEQDWVVLDTLNDSDEEPVSRFICDPSRPTVSVASPGGGRRYEFMLLPGEDRENILADESIARLLKPYREFEPDKITRRAVYTFHARIAERLRQGSVFLLGDAAHLTPPFAGQGMNAGIRDAFNLAWKIALVLNSGAPKRLLDSYDEERRAPIGNMIQLAVAMGEFVMPVGKEQEALTWSVLNALERFPEARDWLFQMRFKPKPRYDRGLFVDLHDQAMDHSLVGSMIPQPRVVDAGGEIDLLDAHLGPGFCLVVQDDASAQAISRLQHPIWRTLNPTKLRLHFDGAADGSHLRCVRVPTDDEISDAENKTYARPFKTHRDQILLLRPDRYAMAAAFPNELADLESKLEAVLNGS